MFNNEDRADMAMRIIDQFSDKNYTVPGEVSDGLRLDITDTIANLLHLCDPLRARSRRHYREVA
jgi:hypothetical protein